MAKAPISLPSREQQLEIHRRLVDGDPTAPADLAVAFLEQVATWLVSANGNRVADDLCADAAEDAIIALSKNPGSYQPTRGKSLYAYLKMSAQGDLLNLLRKEKCRLGTRVKLENLELATDAGKYLGRDDDPSVRLQIHEEVEQAEVNVLSTVRAGLPEAEQQVLQLMLDGERRTAYFARALRIEHLPKDEQEAAVKRVKDKLKNRLRRARGEHGRSS